MRMYLLDKKQRVRRWLKDSDFIEAEMTEEINAANQINFSMLLKERISDNVYYVAIPTPRSKQKYLLFKLLSERVQNDRIEYQGIEEAYDELKQYGYIKDIRPNDRTAEEMLRMVLEPTRWTLSNVPETNHQSTNFYYITYLEALQKIVGLFNIELTFEVTIDPKSNKITRRQVNVYTEQGQRTGKRFEYGSNLLTVQQEQDSQELITALVGRGKGELVSEGHDDTPDGYGRRITFADVVWTKKDGHPVDKPAGQEYLVDPEATALYGFSDGNPRIGLTVFEDIEDPVELINATWRALQSLKRPKVSFKANVTDVGQLGLGDTVAIIRHDLKIEYFTRVYKVKHNLLNENDNQIELGDDFSGHSITSSLIKVDEIANEARETAGHAAIAANGKNNNYYSSVQPLAPVEGDIWYRDLGNGETDMYQYHNGGWVFIQSTRDLHVVENQVKEAQDGLNQAKADIINNKQKADTDIENLNKSIEDNKKVADQDIQNLNKSIEANKKVADESLQKLNDSVTNLQGQYDNNIVPNLNKVIADASDALQKYITAQSSIADLTKRAQQQGKDIADVTNTVKGLNINYANLAGDVNSTKVDVKGLQTIVGTANGDIAQLKLDAQNLQTMLAGKVDNATYTNFVNLTNQALNARLTASDLNGYAKTADVQATANGLRFDLNSVTDRMNNLNAGGRNLAVGTSSNWQSISNFNSEQNRSISIAKYIDLSDVNEGDTLQIGITVKKTSRESGNAQWRIQADGNVTHWNSGMFTTSAEYNRTMKNDQVYKKEYQIKLSSDQHKNTSWTPTIRFDYVPSGTTFYWKSFYVKKSSVPTDWTPAPEDVANDITQLSTRITANSQQFSSYYTKSETDAKADTAKNDAVNAIKSDGNWTGLTNIITNSGFLQSADGFVQKVQQTTVPMFNGGGVNLLLNTRNFDHNWAWDNIDHSYAKGVLTLSDVNNGNSRMFQNVTGDSPIGKIVSVSFNARISADCNSKSVGIKVGPWDTLKSVAITSKDFQRYKVENWQWPGTSSTTFSFFVVDGKIDITDLKLEYGSVATPYSPNPADLATQSAFSELSQSLEGLRSTVGSNYGSLQSQISQSSSSIRTELTDKIKGIDNKTASTANSLNSVIGRMGSLEKITNIQITNHAIDANAYTATGTYFIQSTTSTNVPATNWFYLEVKKVDNGRIMQIWQADSNPTLKFTRTKYNNSWTNWQRAASYSEYSELNQTVQGLQSTVSSHYSTLTNQITQTSKTTRDEITDKVNGLQNQITANANSFNIKISNLNGGGVNLLLSTRNFDHNWAWDNIDHSYAKGVLTLSDVNNGNSRMFQNVTGDSPIGKIVSVSFNARISADCNSKSVGIKVGPWDTLKSVAITSKDFQRYKVENWQWPGTSSTTFSFFVVDGKIDITDLKLEYGSVATPWSPAPEDTEQAFTEVNATINGLQFTVSSNHSDLQSQISQTAKTIRQEVSDKTSGLQTQINQQANNFNVSLNSLRKETAWQKVTSAIDANNYKTTGNYWIQAAPNSNTPDSSAWAYLQVVASPDAKRIKQTWQRDNNENEIYTRLLIEDNWTSWQRTVTGGNIMAQINMSAGTTLIQNDKIYMDASSTIFSGNAFIPSAAITSLNADKITAGTLDAGRINVINLNANNITTGTINGQNLKIDLNTGNVEFQHGRIHNFSNSVDINLDQNYISTANWNTRALLKNGELQLTQPNIFDTNGNWYFRLFNGGGAGDAWAGASLVGRDSVIVANEANAQGATGFTSSPMGTATFSGLFTGKGTNNWMPTILGGAERGVFIKGGNQMSIKQNVMDPNDGGVFVTGSPFISVGVDGPNNNWWGNRIVIDGEYLHVPTAWRHTTGGAPNLVVASDGALVRSTSASKYKTEIHRDYSTNFGDRLLELPTATWIDKGQKERYQEGKRHIKPNKYFGMIAEDLADAGLDLFVSRNPQTHEIEGIQYERIAPALIPVIRKLKKKVQELEEKLNEQ